VRRHRKASSATGRARTALLLSFSAALVALSAFALQAFGATATVHPQLSTPPGPSFDGSGTPAGSFQPQPLAVDATSGDIYVLDVAHGVIDKFDSSGVPADFSALSSPSLDGSSTPAGSFAFSDGSAISNAIAVDDSGTTTDGNIYVADPGHSVVNVFSSAGAYLGRLGGSQIPSGPFGKPSGLAVDSAGNLFVADGAKNRIYEFQPSANPPLEADYASQISDPNLSSPGALAVDSAGNLYATNYRSAVNRFDSSGAFQATVDSNQSTSVAVDPADDNVYVDRGTAIAQYRSAADAEPNALVSSFGSLSESLGVAIDSAGNVLASDQGAGNVAAFGPSTAVDTPTAAIDPVTTFTSTTAHFSGTVNPQGTSSASATSWHFEYSTDGSNWTSTTGGNLAAGTSDVAVSEDVSGLQPATAYTVRLVASNAASEPTGGPTVSGTQGFVTGAAPPSLTTECGAFTPLGSSAKPCQYVSDVTTTEATLNAFIDPLGATTSFRFEYGLDTSYGQSAPIPDSSAGSGFLSAIVSQRISGLVPDTTYHYRIHVSSAGGDANSDDRTFRTASAPVPFQLPDDRAYEMVSPPGKNGGDIAAWPSRTQVVDDGNAVQFVSVAGFGDTHGSGVGGTEYIANRDPSGWDTHAITPLQYPPLVGTESSHYVSDFSPDLSTGIFLGLTPIAGATSANVERVENLYLGTGLRDGHGSFQLLSDAVAPITPPNFHFEPHIVFNDASADFGHALFTTTDNLTQDTTTLSSSTPKAYESDHGAVHLAGILPNGSVAERSWGAGGDGAFEPESSLGGGVQTWLTHDTVSADGERAVFQAGDPVTPNFLSTGGDLYLRENSTVTVQLNVSEKTNGTGPGGTDPNGHSFARFSGASEDGSKIFFTTSEQLTNDDNNFDSAGIETGTDLYRYDTDAPASEHLTLISTNSLPGCEENTCAPSVVYVAAVSEDGAYLYFTSNTDLVPQVPELKHNTERQRLYVWHEGEVRFVAFHRNGAETGQGNGEPWGDYSLSSRVEESLFRFTPDGRNVIFDTIQPETQVLAGFDYGKPLSRHNVYSYSYDTDKLTCVTCKSTGELPATNRATLAPRANTGNQIGLDTQHLSRVATDDGAKLFFSTAEALVPEDTNGKIDAYEYDTATDTHHLISTGECNCDSFFVTTTPDGRDAFFTTNQRLVGIDVDSNSDLYDARIGGGIAAQNPQAPFACEGDACQGQVAAPNDPTPASASFVGAGNVTSKAKKPRHRRHKAKNRAKHRKHRARHVRRTNSSHGGAK
jgi:sugar lactone lactonase YvrE